MKKWSGTDTIEFHILFPDTNLKHERNTKQLRRHKLKQHKRKVKRTAVSKQNDGHQVILNKANKNQNQRESGRTGEEITMPNRAKMIKKRLTWRATNKDRTEQHWAREALRKPPHSKIYTTDKQKKKKTNKQTNRPHLLPQAMLIHTDKAPIKTKPSN